MAAMAPPAVRSAVAASVVFTTLSLAASAVNFAFYPVLAHLLSTASYGDVQVGVSFVMLAAALFTSLNALALYVSARTGAIAQPLGVASPVQPIERVVVTSSLALALVMVAAAQPLARALSLTDASLIYVLGAVFVVNVPASTWIGALQGSGQFALCGWIGLAAAAIKILAGVGFVLLGMGAQGALLGLLLGTFAALPIAKLAQHRVRLSFRQTFRPPSDADRRYFAANRQLGVFLVALMCLAFVASLDIIAAKSLLAPDVAGNYAKASTAAKIPYYALVPVATVLFERFVRGTVSVGRAVLAFLGIAGLLVVATWLFRGLILGLVFGTSSPDAFAPFFPLLVAFTSFAIGLLALFRMVSTGSAARAITLTLITLVAVVVALVLAPRTPTGIAIAFSSATVLGSVAMNLFAYTSRHGRTRA
jgi:O-antigen/teichoic acid export membrane protein